MVKNLSAGAGDMSFNPDSGRPSTAKNQSIHPYIFFKVSLLLPLLLSVYTFSLPDVLHIEDFDYYLRTDSQIPILGSDPYFQLPIRRLQMAQL